MKIKQLIKNQPKVYNIILTILNGLDYFNIRFRLLYPKHKVGATWEKRIQTVKESADNDRIDKVENAGKIYNDYQLMHNGLKISLGSYYDFSNTQLISENFGVHEPQEEYVFQEVLKTLRPGATMVELGSYWAFYSMWLCKMIPESKCFMIEPDPHKMNFGKINFKMNKLTGDFILGFIGNEVNLSPKIPVLTVDYILEQRQISFLDVLHSDIQGYEFEMLLGAEKALQAGNIGYIFVSTHSNELHTQCIEQISKYNYDIICEADLERSYSWDGLIVAKLKGISEEMNKITISKR